MSDHADYKLEQSYLASLIPGGESWFPRYQLSPDSFSDARCRAVMGSISDLADEGVRLDLMSVRTRLAASERLQTVGEDWLLSLSEAPPTSVEFAYQRLGHLRRLRELDGAVKAIAACVDSGDPTATLTLMQDTLDKHRGLAVARTETLHSMVHRNLDALLSPERVKQIPIGISEVDREIGGMAAGNMLTVGADTSVGKSSVALWMMSKAANKGRKVGYVSCEDPEDTIIERALGLYSGVSSQDMRAGRLAEDQAVKVITAAGMSQLKDIIIGNEIGSNEDDVARSMHVMVKEFGAQILIVDYLQTINVSRPTPSRREDVRRIASKLKGTAARIGVPLVLLSQIARQAPGARSPKPSMHMLKECGDIENMSELVIMLWREANPQFVHGELAKSKYGGTGTGFMFERKNGSLVEVC